MDKLDIRNNRVMRIHSQKGNTDILFREKYEIYIFLKKEGRKRFRKLIIRYFFC